MTLDSFDLIIHLVRNGRKRVVRLPFRSRFKRQLVVLARRGLRLPEYVQSFFDRILFANPTAQ